MEEDKAEVARLGPAEAEPDGSGLYLSNLRPVTVATLSDQDLHEICRHRVWVLENTRKAVERHRRAAGQLWDRAIRYPEGADALLQRAVQAEQAALTAEEDCQDLDHEIKKIQVELGRRIRYSP